jgi:hypothetical protein
MADLDQLTVATHRFIRKDPALVDSVFQQDPLLAFQRQNVKEDFTGGFRIDEGFIYDGLIGGAYAKGKEFNITEKQVEQSLQFTMRFYEVDITMSKEDIQVLNKGPMAAFSLVKGRMQNAYLTIGAHIAISQYLNGQRAGYTAMMNGLAEVCNDGTTTNWDGAAYTTYGTITRGGSVGTALNSAATNIAGAISYNKLEETYGNATFGSVEPNLGVTTVLGFSYVKEKFQPQQRFTTQDPKIGFRGLEFNNARIIKSRYAPGSAISGTTDPIVVGFLTQSSLGVVTAYPTLTSETFWWLNATKPYMTFYVSDDPEYGFGFTGWKPAQGNTKVAGQVLAAVQMTANPRYHRELYGITG